VNSYIIVCDLASSPYVERLLAAMLEALGQWKTHRFMGTQELVRGRQLLSTQADSRPTVSWGCCYYRRCCDPACHFLGRSPLEIIIIIIIIIIE
jgi:hypothetical protein